MASFYQAWDLVAADIAESVDICTLHAQWDGNESFPEIATYPSHNKRLDPAQFVRSKSEYLICFQQDSACSSFKSFVVNICLIGAASVGEFPARGWSV